MSWAIQNCVFAWQKTPLDAGPFCNRFASTRRVTLATADPSQIGLEVVCGPKADLMTCDDPETGCCSYLWGKAVHPQHQGTELLRWAAGAIGAGTMDGLAELMG